MGVPAVPMCPNTFSLDKPGRAALAATPCAARYQELPTASDLQELCLDRYLRVTVVPLQPVRDPSEPAARPWLVRYLSEGTPSLRDVGKVTAGLAASSRRDVEPRAAIALER